MKEKTAKDLYASYLGIREESPFAAKFITNAITSSIKMSLGVSLNK